MKKLIGAGFVGALLAVAAVAQDQGEPQLPAPAEEHGWLAQLVGEWESQTELFMAPDQPPLTSKGTESVRAVGGFWVVSENKGEAFGQPFTGILTLGYDAGKKHYVGTWIDSMTGYLWTYKGKVDAEGKTLTLETRGPGHEGPDKLANYKEVLEIKSKDHKVFTSYIETDEGWYKMLTVNYRRKK